MVLLGVVVTAVILFTKDQPPYQKAIYKQQSVSEELTSDTAAPITAANETYVRAWSADTLCSFNGEDGPFPDKDEACGLQELLQGLCYCILLGTTLVSAGLTVYWRDYGPKVLHWHENAIRNFPLDLKLVGKLVHCSVLLMSMYIGLSI
jgi:hypothetical protein